MAARASLCLPGLRARRPGWLGCAWVPAPALAPAMGNSHHKRKAPSCPRARSFWRFGRSAKRPAGRGWGWGRGRRGGGSHCCSCSCRHCCCPLPGLGTWPVCVEGRESPAQTPLLTFTERHTYIRMPTGGICVCSQFTQSHNTHSDVQICRHKITYTHSHLHLCCRMHRS